MRCRECGEEAFYPAPSFRQVVLPGEPVPGLSAPGGRRDCSFLSEIRPELACGHSGQKPGCQ